MYKTCKQILKERILKEGRCFPGGILKVDSFVNHQMDPNFMFQVARDFVASFSDLHINKVITIEASGIAPAIMVGFLMNVPVVFVKKKAPSTMEKQYVSKVHSFTKNREYDVCVSQEYLKQGDRLLFIDDFLANGNAATGVLDLCKQAGAEIVAMGFIIEKSFQKGGELLRSLGVRYEALASIESLDDCQIKLRD